MPQIRFRLDPGRMANPDLDIRYLLPDSLAALPDSTMKDNGYDYSDDTPPFLMIFVTSDAPDADVERSLEFLRTNQLLENNVLDAATVCISDGGDEWRQVYPRG